MTQHIQGDITVSTLKKHVDALHSLSTSKMINIDFSEVGRIDSSLLSYILHIIRYTSSRNQVISLSNLPTSFLELAQLYGVEPFIQPYLLQTRQAT